ncbi:MAG: 5'/3'-nucleotidase SurE [Halobacteriovoraceae bacterium]|nr:5'/3'-nucleotidase SurE [Halobacteriovoraceae bacterium]|tara:strand:+ start:6306 stop:7103 length:798 start_codon:yes stop_codon:yes gene_type:complete
MNILISNDDGVRAQGIKFLNEELMTSFKTTVVAPDRERSSCGHGITLGEPIRLNKLKDNIYECTGFPADCILVSIGKFFKDNKPDVVVSGINHGANLGQDRFYSGTMAAAREACFRGVPSIAVSLVTKAIKDLEHFDLAAKAVKVFLQNDLHKLIPPMCLVNINVPNVPLEELSGVKVCFPGYQNYSEEIIERVDARGRNYFWVGGTYKGHMPITGSDCDAVDSGYIAIDLQNLSGNNVEFEEQFALFSKKVNNIGWKSNLGSLY